jgi:hypothetical protein
LLPIVIVLVSLLSHSCPEAVNGSSTPLWVLRELTTHTCSTITARRYLARVAAWHDVHSEDGTTTASDSVSKQLTDSPP